MKIGPSNPDSPRIDGKPVGADRASTPRGPSSSDPAAPLSVAPLSEVDRVSLSGSGSTLAGGTQAFPFDEGKVAEIRRAIAEGRFPVDAKRIADALLAETRERMGLPADR